MAYKGRKTGAAVLQQSALTALAVVLIDRLVKLWCAGSLKQAGSIPVIEGVFHLTYAENTGAAFSMLSGRRWLLVCVSLVAIGIIAYVLFTRLYAHPLTDLAFPLVAGGAIGNLWDRVAMGYVVDLFDFRLINFAIFNVADVAITTGAGLLIIYIILALKNGY